MKIQTLDEKNIKDIIRIEQNIFGKIAENEEIILDRIKTFKEGCFGAFENKELIGYCSSEIWKKKHPLKRNVRASLNHDCSGKILYISGLGIIEEFRKRNIGTKLLNKLISLAQKRKLELILLRTSFPKSISFYQKKGFFLTELLSLKKQNYKVLKLEI